MNAVADAGETTRPLPSRNSGPSGRASGDDPTPAEQRGTTTLANKVVEKIAARAALDIDHAGGLSRRVAGRSFGTSRVRAHADIDGHIASLTLELAVEYPASARATTRSVRHHVGEHVGRLCALTVDHIDITVAVLRRSDLEGKRVQ